jgi:tetratricopeptide (TPR) repeat protein
MEMNELRFEKELRNSGKSKEDLEKEYAKSALEEEAAMYTLFEITGCGSSHPFPTSCCETCLEEDWRFPINNEMNEERDAAHIGLRLSAALDALGKRTQAINALQRALFRRPDSSKVRLQLARMLFRQKLHDLAINTLEPILTSSNGDITNIGQFFSDINDRIKSDAFYISGWAFIHGRDDHTMAYSIWAKGAMVIPSDTRLSRQLQKLNTWAPIREEKEEVQWYGDDLGAILTSRCEENVDIITVPETIHEPALSLFDPIEQKRAIAFTTRKPFMSKNECKAVLHEVDNYIQSKKNGTWSTVRRSQIPTTDCAVEDIPSLIPWLRKLLSTRIYPLIEVCFPLLADGTQTKADRIRVHDAFIVRYDSNLGSISLPEHSDTSAVSVSLSLSSEEDGDYKGGGLWLQQGNISISAPQGCATIFAGPLRHGGSPITKGVRMILVLFLYIEGFAYGKFLSIAKNILYKEKEKEEEDSERDGGRIEKKISQAALVVYRETVQLVEALEMNE